MGNLIAYGYAPASIVTPIGSIGLSAPPPCPPHLSSSLQVRMLLHGLRRALTEHQLFRTTLRSCREGASFPHCARIICSLCIAVNPIC